MNVGTIIALLVVLTFVFILAGIPIYVSLLFTGVLSLVALSVTTNTPVATLAVAQSIFNGIGRVILGSMYDKIGRSRLMQIVNGIFIVAGVILIIALKSSSFPVIILGFIVGGLAYGGVTPTNSAFVSDYYGMKNYPMNFSVINTNLIFASFGSTIAGALYDSTQSFTNTCMMIVILAIVGIFISLGISLCDRKMLAGKRGQDT